MNRKELSLEEKLLGYSKYYYMDIEPANPIKLQFIKSGPIDTSLALAAEDIPEKMFEPGYHNAEFGYCIFDDGRSFMANYERLAGVSPEMLDWWFVWHWIRPAGVPRECGNLRYKIWCAPDHFDTWRDPETEKIFADESLSLAERRQYGRTAYIVESLDLGKGDEKRKSAVVDLRFEDFGLSAETIAWLNRQRCKLYCGASSGGTKINMHFVRPIYGGVEVKTRSWSGYGVSEGKVVKTEIPEITGEKLVKNLIHNITEWQHLQKFLPSLYAEESWKPVAL